MSNLEAIDVSEALHYGPVLTRTLDRSKLLQQKPAPWQGQPARMLSFKVDIPISASQKKRIKELDATLTVWTGPDGAPLAIQQTVRVKARFLLMTFEQTTNQEMAFARWGDHLVAIRTVERETGHGMGQNFDRTKTQVITKN